MKKIRFYSILFVILSILFGFFTGIGIALLTDAGEGQMLAAGAIVLSYGVISASIGLLVSIYLATVLSRQFITRLNGVVAVLLTLLIISLFTFSPKNHKDDQTYRDAFMSKPGPEIKYAGIPSAHSEGKAPDSSTPFKQEIRAGLGFFRPDTDINNSLYFYGSIIRANNPAPVVVDSVTFYKNEYGQKAISYAPPWLFPEHMKLDYGFLYFKIITIYRGHLEVEVNTKTHRTAIVSNTAGTTLLWPEFLLNVHSIELSPEHDSPVRTRPFEYSDAVRIRYEILQPIAVKDQWLKVNLTDANYNSLGEGWVKWYENGQIIINYSLLS